MEEINEKYAEYFHQPIKKTDHQDIKVSIICIFFSAIFFSLLYFFATSLNKNFVTVKAKMDITYTVGAVDVYRYHSNPVHFYVYLIDENNEVETIDNYELYTKVKEHIGQKIKIEFLTATKHNQKNNKNYFTRKALSSPINITYLEDGISEENNNIKTIESLPLLP